MFCFVWGNFEMCTYSGTEVVKVIKHHLLQKILKGLTVVLAGKPWGKCSGCVFTRSRPLGAHSACPGLYAQDCPLCSACRSLAGVSPEGLTWEHVGFPGDHRTPAEAASSPRTPMMQAPTPAPPAGLLPSLESSPPGARMQQEAYRHQRNTSHQRMD